MTGGYRHRPDRPAPEFDKGTLARTLIGLYGQVTSLPNRPESLRVLTPCQIPALSALSPRTHLRSPADAGKADTVVKRQTGPATERDVRNRGTADLRWRRIADSGAGPGLAAAQLRRRCVCLLGWSSERQFLVG